MASRLERYERQYRSLAAELAEVGFISSGSVVCRHTYCGKPGCCCEADPPRPHGPYYQWTRKVAGKTVTRRLDEREAQLYTEWINNGRRVAAITARMQRVSAQAAEILLRQPTLPGG